MKQKHEEEVITISKETFSKLSKAEQRMYIAQDVIDRINLKQFTAMNGSFCYTKRGNVELEKGLISNILKDPKVTCEVCAKGGLFMAFIGIVNKHDLKETIAGANAYKLNSKPMNFLSEIFTKYQLTLIETAYEGRVYPYNLDLTTIDEKKCLAFYFKCHGKEADMFSKPDTAKSNATLKAICKNIIKNKGLFIP